MAKRKKASMQDRWNAGLEGVMVPDDYDIKDARIDMLRIMLRCETEKTTEAPKKAREVKREKKNGRYKKISDCVLKHWRSNKRNTITYSREAAAKELDVSISTVLRATENLQR